MVPRLNILSQGRLNSSLQFEISALVPRLRPRKVLNHGAVALIVIEVFISSNGI